MIDISSINNKLFDIIQFDQLTYHEPFYIVSYKKDVSFISPIINIKNNIYIDNNLNNFLTALVVNNDDIISFMKLYNDFIVSDFIKSKIIKFFNNQFKTEYNISSFIPEKLFLEDEDHICFNMYTRNCTSQEIINTVCPSYVQKTFPREHFITPYYEHKKTKFYIQKPDKEEIDYDTFLKVYNQYNNLQFIFGLSNINIQPKINKFIYSQHKYVKEVILMD